MGSANLFFSMEEFKSAVEESNVEWLEGIASKYERERRSLAFVHYFTYKIAFMEESIRSFILHAMFCVYKDCLEDRPMDRSLRVLQILCKRFGCNFRKLPGNYSLFGQFLFGMQDYVEWKSTFKAPKRMKGRLVEERYCLLCMDTLAEAGFFLPLRNGDRFERHFILEVLMIYWYRESKNGTVLRRMMVCLSKSLAVQEDSLVHEVIYLFIFKEQVPQFNLVFDVLRDRINPNFRRNDGSGSTLLHMAARELPSAIPKLIHVQNPLMLDAVGCTARQLLSGKARSREAAPLLRACHLILENAEIELGLILKFGFMRPACCLSILPVDLMLAIVQRVKAGFECAPPQPSSQQHFAAIWRS